MESSNLSETSPYLCDADEVEEGRSRKFVVKGKEILLLKFNGSIKAIESFCPHTYSDFSLGKISVRTGTIKCPNHGAIFDLKNGKALCGPFGVDGEILPPLTFFKLKVDRDGKVYLIVNGTF